MKLLFAILFALMSQTALAEGRSLTITDYFGGDVNPGDVVCEVLDLEKGETRCYLALELSKTLTAKNDSTGMLRRGTVSPEQRQFTQVQVQQLLSEIDGLRPGSSVHVFVKVSWSAVDNGPLSKKLGANHIVQGKLYLSESGVFKFELVNIPDMFMLGMYNPSLDVAEAFGRMVVAENHLIERDMRLWMEAILWSVLPEAYQAKVNTLK